MANDGGAVSGAATAIEGLAVIAIDGAAVTIVAADDTLGVNGATTAGTATNVGVTGANTDVDTGFCGVGSGDEADQDGSDCCE